MGYNIWLNRGDSKSEIKAKFGDVPKGGQYRLGDDDEDVSDGDLELYVTYNYSWYFYEAIDKDHGVRSVYGMKAGEAADRLEKALPKLDEMIAEEKRTGKVLSETWGVGEDYDDESTDYWAVSAKNAEKAVEALISLCRLAPDFTVEGD